MLTFVGDGMANSIIGKYNTADSISWLVDELLGWVWVQLFLYVQLVLLISDHIKVVMF